MNASSAGGEIRRTLVPWLLGEARDQPATEGGSCSLRIDSLAVIGDRQLVHNEPDRNCPIGRQIALSMLIVSAIVVPSIWIDATRVAT
jgi:hypothetical protein